MKLISFNETSDHISDRIKTVTRRKRTNYYKPGDILAACKKTRWIRKEDRDQLAIIRVIDIRTTNR